MKKFIVIILVIVIVLSISVFVSADSIYELPEIPNVYANQGSFIRNISGDIYLHIIDNKDDINFAVNNGTVFLYGRTLETYTISNNIWIKVNTYYQPAGSWVTLHGGTLLQSQLFYSDFDIKSSSGVFFSKVIPPMFIFNNKTLLQPLRQSVTQNSQILLVCGVGILSLILLVGLFRKLYLYL